MILPLFEPTFLLRLLASFIVGGLWVGLTTLIAERSGSKIGGLIGGLPATIAVSLFFIGITQSPNFAAESTTIVPLACSLNFIFGLGFWYFAPRGLLPAISAAAPAWLCGAGILYYLRDFISYPTAIIIWIAMVLATYYVFEHGLKVKSRNGTKLPYTKWQLLGRILFAGSVVAATVVASRIGGPTLGGIFASFPALLSSTLIIVHRYQGHEFTRSMCKSTVFSGMINAVIYSIVVRYTYPEIGMLWGTLVSFGVSYLSGYCTFLFMRKWMS